MDIKTAINKLESEISNPSCGLPDDIFYFISKITPLVNVDLLVKDSLARTLLAWRKDPIAGNGWHLPGGIVRFKETFGDRIQKVSELEIGDKDINFNPNPLAINQIIRKIGKTRGHFISILYKCTLSDNFKIDNRELTEEEPGYLMWHNSCPDNLLSLQREIYSEYV